MGISGYKMIEMFSAVAELTNFNMDEIFRLPAVEFFAYLEFINARNNKKMAEQREQIRRQKAAMRKKH